jgi:hypothetical protein
MTPEFIFSPQGQELRNKAKVLTGKQMDLYLRGRLGLVVDGTGKNYEKIAAQASKLKELGYDVSMIFVNTDLKTAINRDAKRDRTLGPKTVEKLWSGVQKNIGKFQALFKKNFVIVDNSDDADWKKGTTDAYKRMSKFAAAEPKNPIAKRWIAQQRGEVTEGEGEYKGETWEDGYKRRVVKVDDPEHIKMGHKWRIKGKERDEITIKYYENKPDFAEYKKQMKRVAGHEFGG